MKTARILAILIAAATVCISMQLRQPVQAIALDARLNSPFISEMGGTAYLQLTVTTADIAVRSERKPMNLSIVLDRSGSMSSENKMGYAKQAFLSLIDQLRPDDMLSVVVYDDEITVLRKARKVGNNKASIKRIVEEIYPRGSTNLGGGLLEGLRQAERYASGEHLNRVVLLSDGLANVGITDPHELNQLSRRYRNKSISITTMGVGLDYNENLMIGLAESGGGNYYFIERANDLASIVRRELDMISSVLAQNASISVTLGKGVLVNDIIGCNYTGERNTVVIPVGDLYANDRKEFTLELTVPKGTGSMTIASGHIRYEAEKIGREYPTFSTLINYTRDVAVIEKHRDMETQAKSDVAVSTRKVEQAMESLDAGDVAAAERRLEEAKEIITASPAASASGAGGDAVRSQLGRIESYKKSTKDEDARKAKKSIQYENYRVQKNK